MQPRHALILAAAISVLAAGRAPAVSVPDHPLAASPPADTFVTLSGTVVETLDAAGYTYLKIKSNGGSSWAAIPKSSVKVGEQVTLLPGLETRNVESKALGRTFATVVFSPGVAGGERTATPSSSGNGMMLTSPGEGPPVTISGRVAETLSGGGYTYIAVERDGSRKWVAIPEGNVKMGQTAVFLPGTVMVNFKSKALNRTFESIVFSDGIAPIAKDIPPAPKELTTPIRTVFHGSQEFSLEPVAGEVAEAITSGGYTYLLIRKEGREIWVAISETGVKAGDRVELQPGEVKRNYVSKKLGRTLPLVMFSRGSVGR